MNNTKITIDVLVSADVNKVWKYYNSPEHITKWNFASDDWFCPKAENDLREGGKLKSRMEAKDGSFGFDFEGIYNEVIEHEKITYTLTDGRKVETHFEIVDGKTKITTTFDVENENPVEMQRAGWQAILYNFKKYAETSSSNK